MFGSTSLSPREIIIMIICILVSLTIHEFMHAFTAYKLGDNTAFEGGRVSFNPLRHIDPFMTVLLPVITTILPPHSPILAAKPVPFDPNKVKHDEFGAALVAAAGPLSNLAMAIIGAFFLHSTQTGSLMETVIGTFTVINVSLFVFNSIPIPPLDGSRVLYAFAPDAVRRLFDQIEPIGLLVVFGLVFIGGFGGILVNLNNFVLRLLS